MGIDDDNGAGTAAGPDDLPAEFGFIDGVRDVRDARIAELDAALREIVRLCRTADDPDHMTLGLVGRIAEDVLPRHDEPKT